MITRIAKVKSIQMKYIYTKKIENKQQKMKSKQ